MNDVFSSNNNFKKNAYLNWRTKKNDDLSNMIVIAEGYEEATFSLINSVLNDNHDNKADSLIFPILFNANHSMEVYLKNICWSLNRLLKKDETIKGNKFAFHHELDKHYQNMIALENEYQPNSNKKEFTDLNSHLNKYITELYSKTKDITFPRYTLGKENPQFYVEELDNVTIDLENLKEMYTVIFNNLNQLSYHFTQLLENQRAHEQMINEQESEMQSELND